MYIRYIKDLREDLNKLDVTTLIKISQYYYDKGFIDFKYVEPTDEEVKKFFNIQSTPSLGDILNKFIEKLTNDYDFKDNVCNLNRVDAIYVSEFEKPFFEDKFGMIDEFIDIIYDYAEENKAILDYINNNFNLNIQLKSEYEENHKGEEED